MWVRNGENPAKREKNMNWINYKIKLREKKNELLMLFSLTKIKIKRTLAFSIFLNSDEYTKKTLLLLFLLLLLLLLIYLKKKIFILIWEKE
jgi:hypothetical protein